MFAQSNTLSKVFLLILYCRRILDSGANNGRGSVVTPRVRSHGTRSSESTCQRRWPMGLPGGGSSGETVVAGSAGRVTNRRISETSSLR